MRVVGARGSRARGVASRHRVIGGGWPSALGADEDAIEATRPIAHEPDRTAAGALHELLPLWLDLHLAAAHGTVHRSLLEHRPRYGSPDPRREGRRSRDEGDDATEPPRKCHRRGLRFGPWDE